MHLCNRARERGRGGGGGGGREQVPQEHFGSVCVGVANNCIVYLSRFHRFWFKFNLGDSLPLEYLKKQLGWRKGGLNDNTSTPTLFVLIDIQLVKQKPQGWTLHFLGVFGTSVLFNIIDQEASLAFNITRGSLTNLDFGFISHFIYKYIY